MQAWVGRLKVELQRAFDGRARRSALLIVGLPCRPIDLFDRNVSQQILEVELQKLYDFALPRVHVSM